MPMLNPGEPVLTRALAEAAQAGQVRYLWADTTGDWQVTRAKPRQGRAYYRLFPGGRVEHHLFPQRSRRG